MLINYVAVKLGGVHLDPKRENDSRGRTFAALDDVESALNGRAEPFAQILGIVRVLNGSEDISRLRAALGA